MRMSSGQLREAGVHDLEARVGDRIGALPGRCDGDRVAVDADHARAGAQAAQQLARVPAPAEGAVDIDAVRCRHERVDRFVEQDGGMQPRVFHDA
jgi:hypothetical protein